MSLRQIAADPRPRATRGFVLLEVLVAVGVAAIIMAALLRSFSTTWAGIHAVREEAESMLVARALLSDGAATARIVPGTQSGTIGRYAWSLTAVALPVAPPPQPAQPAQPAQDPQQAQQQAGGADQQPQPNPFALYRIDLVITTPSGRSKSLETYRIGPAAQP